MLKYDHLYKFQITWQKNKTNSNWNHGIRPYPRKVSGRNVVLLFFYS